MFIKILTEVILGHGGLIRGPLSTFFFGPASSNIRLATHRVIYIVSQSQKTQFICQVSPGRNRSSKMHLQNKINRWSVLNKAERSATVMSSYSELLDHRLQSLSKVLLCTAVVWKASHSYDDTICDQMRPFTSSLHCEIDPLHCKHIHQLLLLHLVARGMLTVVNARAVSPGQNRSNYKFKKPHEI